MQWNIKYSFRQYKLIKTSTFIIEKQQAMNTETILVMISKSSRSGKSKFLKGTRGKKC